MIDKSLIGEKKKKRINNKFSSGSAYKSIQSDGCKVLNSANICILPFLLYIKKRANFTKTEGAKGRPRQRDIRGPLFDVFASKRFFIIIIFFFFQFKFFFHDFLNFVVRAAEPTESHRDPPEN